jgi:hypothetical protein
MAVKRRTGRLLVGLDTGFGGICLILSQKLTIIHIIKILLLPDPLLTQNLIMKNKQLKIVSISTKVTN